MPFVLLTRVTCTSAHATQQIANPVVRTSHITTLEFAIHDRKKGKNFLRASRAKNFSYYLIAVHDSRQKKFVLPY